MPARHMLWLCVSLSVRLSVRPSVTIRCAIKTTKDTVTQTTLQPKALITVQWTPDRGRQIQMEYEKFATVDK